MPDPRRVLVVEDDDVLRRTLRDALRFEDYEVQVAAHGAEALSVLETWRPDLILLDLMMPVMDGWAFRENQRARAGLRDIPVLLLSASRDLAQARVRLSPAAALAKPFDLDALLQAVQSCIQGDPSGAAARRRPPTAPDQR